MTKETKRVGRECLGLEVRMLSRLISGIYDDAMSGVGLKVSQFTVLVAVVNQERARPSELAKVLAMDESTLSRNVERMCARGWLRLEPDKDRRSHRIQVTEKGMVLIRKAYPAWQNAQAKVRSSMGADGVAALESALRKLRA
jgi:DNA-binding MarR family transcriptional regulator